jgi:hypothetical protein
MSASVGQRGCVCDALDAKGSAGVEGALEAIDAGGLADEHGLCVAVSHRDMKSRAAGSRGHVDPNEIVS